MGLLHKEESHNSSTLTPVLFLKHSFHVLSLTLLTLLLPLSFLLLARLAHSSLSSPLAALLRSLVSLLSASSLLYSLSGRALPMPRLAVAWPFLIAFQLCVTVGIELTIAEGVKPTRTAHALWIERAVFFLGLYETMLHWSRMFVRPVVDDTVFGAKTGEDRISRAAVGVAFGALWLRVLRDDVEPLLSAAGREGLVAAVSGCDAFVLWFVSYTTVVIGVVRVVEVVWGVGKLMCLFLCCGPEVDDAHLSSVPVGDEV